MRSVNLSDKTNLEQKLVLFQKGSSRKQRELFCEEKGSVRKARASKLNLELSFAYLSHLSSVKEEHLEREWVPLLENYI